MERKHIIRRPDDPVEFDIIERYSGSVIRCDRCQIRASYRILLRGKELDICGHHYGVLKRYYSRESSYQG